MNGAGDKDNVSVLNTPAGEWQKRFKGIRKCPDWGNRSFMKKRVAIIGAGASGMAAAVTASRRREDVILLEVQDQPGKKILATGNGKCNYTNAKMTADCFRSGSMAQVREVLSAFSMEETVAFLQSLGIEPMVKNGYYYPASGQAASVRAVFEMELAHRKVPVVTNCRIVRITKEKDGFQLRSADGKTYRADRVILSCGSKAGIAPQKAAGGYELAKALGHHVTGLYPALTGIRCAKSSVPDWAGVRINGMIALEADRVLAADTGELQLTDYGVSGIPAFQVSRYAAVALAEGKKVCAVLDFFPGKSRKDLELLLFERHRQMSYKSGQELLIGLLPDRLIRALIKRSPQLSLSLFAEQLKRWELTVAGVNPLAQAQVCAGGIPLTEINPETMESKKTKGLYLTGEMLDADGICGGYNLQWAWATGVIAGRSV